MLKRPRFKPHLCVEKVEGEGVFLLWETGQVLLKGRVHELVAPLLDGQCSSDQIVGKLSGQVSAPQVYYALQELERRGYLSEGDESIAPGFAALWSIQGIDPSFAVSRLTEGTVSTKVLGVSVEDHQPSLHRALESWGIRIGDEAAKLTVVLTDDYLREGLSEINRQALEERRPWLLAQPVGGRICIGPFFLPTDTACWECLAIRLRCNRPTEGFIAARRSQGEEAGPLARAATLSSLNVAWNIVASETASFLVRGAQTDRANSILTVDTLGWQTQRHVVVRLPHCSACGANATSSRVGEPIVFNSQRKIFTRDGGHRVVSPEVTLARYAHHVSPLTGVITDLTRCEPTGDGAFFIYKSGQIPPDPITDLADLRRGLRSGKSGKGASDLQAKASALCEGLERHSGTFRGDEARRLGRFRDFRDAAIHPNACMLLSEKQYRERDWWNQRETRYNFVPEPLHDDAEISWTPVWSLTRRESRYLPTASCYYGFVDKGVKPFALSCSNGCAAGNTREEAVLQGFLELVERDSVALWWYNRVRRPAVDIDSFGDPYLAEVRAYLGKMHRDLWAIDLTADLGIPVIAALSRRVDRAPERILIGLGAHLDPKIALLRAVTEVNQMLSWTFHVESDPPEPLESKETMNWLQNATVANQLHLLPDLSVAARSASSFQKQANDDLRDDLLHCQSLVESRGLEMLVLDQSRSDIGLSVVKVFVPGLRHFWARYAPGRLYDVPVKLGWRDKPLAEEELNPIPFFL